MTAGTEAFGRSRELFEAVVGWLDGPEAAALTHAELEAGLDERGREVLRRLLGDHLEVRADRERRAEVTDAEGVAHGAVEAGHA